MTSDETEAVVLLDRGPGGAAAVSPPAARGGGARVPADTGGDLFTRYTRDYVKSRSGRPVAVLNAGCTTARDLGTAALRAEGAEVIITLVDDDQPATAAAVAAQRAPGTATLGDLRTIPFPPRAFDIVQCALLERIRHTELVLDRLVAALRPGGLLLLRIRDRDSAGAFLDRILPRAIRRALARTRVPRGCGPRPAVYERLSSVPGLQAYALLRGLVIAERQALGGIAGGLTRGPRGYLAAQRFVAALSRGRLTAAHEELLFVLRKPENRFARVL